MVDDMIDMVDAISIIKFNTLPGAGDSENSSCDFGL